MAGGLSESVMGRFEALEDGGEAVAFLASLVTRGRSSYTVRTYALGLAHFLEWTAARGVRLVAVDRGEVVAYVAEFGRR
jgi:hypothetical protein